MERNRLTDRQTEKQRGGWTDRFFNFQWHVIRECVLYDKMIDYKFFALLSQLLNLMWTVRKVRGNKERKGI